MTVQDMSRLRDEAMRLLEDALKKPSTEVRSEVDHAERAVAQLREALIDGVRAHAAPELGNNLDAANVPLSLIVGLE
jgi:hypothetical protein